MLLFRVFGVLGVFEFRVQGFWGFLSFGFWGVGGFGVSSLGVCAIGLHSVSWRLDAKSGLSCTLRLPPVFRLYKRVSHYAPPQTPTKLAMLDTRG